MDGGISCLPSHLLISFQHLLGQKIYYYWILTTGASDNCHHTCDLGFLVNKKEERSEIMKPQRSIRVTWGPATEQKHKHRKGQRQTQAHTIPRNLLSNLKTLKASACVMHMGGQGCDLGLHHRVGTGTTVGQEAGRELVTEKEVALEKFPG